MKDYNKLLELQANKCQICQKEIKTAAKPTPNRACIDHDHLTGQIRGLLCHTCNLGLGFFQDNPTFLRHAYTYLEEAFNAFSKKWNSQLQERGRMGQETTEPGVGSGEEEQGEIGPGAQGGRSA